MATPASRTVPSSPNPSAQGSPRARDWSNLRTSEPGSAFRGISRGRGIRGNGIKSGRGGGHPPNNSARKAASLPDSVNNTPSLPKDSSVLRKPPVTPAISINDGEKSVNSATERSVRPKPGSRKQPSRATAQASPSETPQTAPPTPSRSANRRRRSHTGKASTTTTKPPPLSAAVKSQKSPTGSTPATQTILRKDVPPHLAAAHDAEVRHDIDALVERVRAVAMAENRPMTPGSHIDWAGDEDDSLPDLDDWGITTTHSNVTRNDDRNEEISPILTDTLKPLPEPKSDVRPEEEETETYDDTQPEQADELPSLRESEEALEQCVTVPTVTYPPALPNGNSPLHPSLPPKPVAAMECLRARGESISEHPSLPLKPPVVVTEEELLTNKTDGLAESIHAPPLDELVTSEGASGASSSERGLTASIHAPAPVPALPESHSAPSLLTNSASSTVPRTHSRSQTEGRLGNHQPHTSAGSHRHGRRSGASSPLGKHVYTHSRNHSTPVGNSRQPQTSRPVITGDAISRLARTIGGLTPAPRAQTIPVTKDSTISS